MKQWAAELGWIFSLLVLALLIDFLLLGRSSLAEDTVDIQFHNTYFLVNTLWWILFLFVLLSALAYTLREALRGFRRRLPNVVLFLLLTVLLLFVLLGHRGAYEWQTTGRWTVHPPLSEPDLLDLAPDSPLIPYGLFLGVELALIISLVFLGIKVRRTQRTA